MNEIIELSHKMITLNKNQYLSVEGDIDQNIYVTDSGSLLLFLKRNPQLFQEVPNRYIANYFRMRPATFSKLKSLDLNQDLG